MRFMYSVRVINHVHFKDINANGKWCIMGEGITDFTSIIKILKSNDYNGYKCSFIIVIYIIKAGIILFL